MTKRMMVPLAVLASTVLAVLAGCGGGKSASATPVTAATSGADTADIPTVVAQGSGRASAPPDVVTVTMGIHTQAKKAADALDENSLRTQALLDVVKAQGVDDKDIQTVNVSVGPTYDEKYATITGYQVDNTVTVKLRDLDRAGEIIDAMAAPAGDAFRMQGLAFSIDDTDPLMAAARKEAVTKAKAQAQQMAEAAGVALGKVRTISEVPTTVPSPYYGALRDAAGQPGGDASVAVPIAPGSQEVSVQVTVVYELDQ